MLLYESLRFTWENIAILLESIKSIVLQSSCSLDKRQGATDDTKIMHKAMMSISWVSSRTVKTLVTKNPWVTAGARRTLPIQCKNWTALILQSPDTKNGKYFPIGRVLDCVQTWSQVCTHTGCFYRCKSKPAFRQHVGTWRSCWNYMYVYIYIYT